MAKDQALDGPSNAKKMYKSKKHPLKPSTAKKQMSRQLLEALERDAMDYVSSSSKAHRPQIPTHLGLILCF